MNSRQQKKYRIANKNRFRELYNFALQYPEFLSQLRSHSYVASPNLDGMPRGGAVGNPTERIGITEADLRSKVSLIEQCAREADPTIYKAVLYAVTQPHISYNYLSTRGYVHCGRDKFFIARQKFYWLLDKRKI